MRVFKALIYNQIPVFYVKIKSLIMSILFAIFLPIIFQYMNIGSSVAAIPGLVQTIFIFIIMLIGVNLSIISVQFERSENMAELIFSMNINKLHYIISKLLIPTLLSFIISIIPVYAMLQCDLYCMKDVSFVMIESCILVCILIANLSAAFISLLIKGQLISTIFSLLSTLIIVVYVFLEYKPWLGDMLGFYFKSFTVIISLTVLSYFYLKKKESKFNFVKFKCKE